MPIHPMFAVRLRVFIDWHRLQGRRVELIAPRDVAAGKLFDAMRIGDEAEAKEDDAVLPVTKMSGFLDVEEVAARTKGILEYDLPDVSLLGEATFEAVSELCGNAFEHGKNPLGAYVAVRRVAEPRRQIYRDKRLGNRDPRARPAAISRMGRRRIRDRTGDDRRGDRYGRCPSWDRVLLDLRSSAHRLATRGPDGHPLGERFVPSSDRSGKGEDRDDSWP